MASGGSLLLALPDNCLLAVLQYCAADDLRSLFSAARAHSRLHQAASGALHVIDAPLCQQQQAASLLRFLAKYADHIAVLDVWKAVGADPYATIRLRQLPRPLQLRSLLLRGLKLGPSHACKGVLGVAGAADLQVLSLQDCCLANWATADALAAALWQLPALEHLSIRNVCVYRPDDDDAYFQFSTGVFQQLLQLTCLQLAGVQCEGPAEHGPTLQPLQALTRLSVLQLTEWEADDDSITASMLSGMQHLTCLVVSDPPFDCVLEPGMLAGKTRLQHLTLHDLCWHGVAVTELLSHLQHLQQLTHLGLENSMQIDEEDSGPPAAAFSALTASSKLQLLDITDCRLPEGIWPHIFPAGRQLPDLQTLVLTDVEPPSGDWGTPPDGSMLASCCPGLQELHMQQQECTAELLTSLQGLSKLHSLWLAHCSEERTWEGLYALEAVGRLTGLRQLSVEFLSAERLLLQLTTLKQLTALTCCCLMDGGRYAKEVKLKSEAPGDEPVWRQVLRLHLNHSDPGVAQQAAAALAE